MYAYGVNQPATKGSCIVFATLQQSLDAKQFQLNTGRHGFEDSKEFDMNIYCLNFSHIKIGFENKIHQFLAGLQP